MQGFENVPGPKGSRSRLTEVGAGSLATLPSGEGAGFGFASKMHELADDRKQLIFRIRRQIAEKTYDTPEKFDAALERMIDSLGLDGGPGDWLT